MKTPRFWNAKKYRSYDRDQLTVGDLKRILQNFHDLTPVFISISDETLDKHFKHFYLISFCFGIGDWRYVPRLIRRLFDWGRDRFHGEVACGAQSVVEGLDQFCLCSDVFVPRNPVEWIDGNIIPPERQLPAGQGLAKGGGE